MGGGVSSVSKVCVVGKSKAEDADVDYTFAAISIRGTEVDFSSNCGNMTAAIGPFAVNEKLVDGDVEGEATVRIRNTNTGKMIHSSFPVEDGEAVVEGDFAIDGVAGTGAKIKLAFLNPAYVIDSTVVCFRSWNELLINDDIGVQRQEKRFQQVTR